MSQRAATLLGFGLVSTFLLVLAVAPRFFTQRRFEIKAEGPAVGDTVDPRTALPAYNFPSDISFAAESASFRTSKKLALEALFGDKKTLIINFWATWCPPCLDELPSLELLNRQLTNATNAASLPRLITVSVDELTAPIDKLFKTLDFKPTFLVLHDPDGSFARQLGTTRFPETYWIDQSGKILHRWIGPQDWLSKEVIEKLSQAE